MLALPVSALLWAFAATAPAADLEILPARTTLSGPHAAQRLIVEEEAGGQWVGDDSARATFVSSNPAVAVVDKDGIVRPVSDGAATITATVAGRSARAAIRVERSRMPSVRSFRNEVIPAMTKIGCNSGACHGALAGKGGQKLSLRGYNIESDHFVLTRQALGRRVDLSNPARSLMLLKPTMTIRHGGGQKIEPGSPDYRVLAEWIAAGAPAPRATDPRITGLEVFPPGATLRPGKTQQVVVRANYSDGHTADVTHWVKFASSDDLVATVSDDGLATVRGSGEAAITITYSNLVTFVRFTSPLPAAVDPQVFAAAPRHNFIDQRNLQKLQTLHIPPSPLCSDAEFIRRVELDAAGILPTPEELQRFVADPAPDKRAKLIDRVLQRPEFVDYWAYKWSDLMLVSSKRLRPPAMWAYYEFIHQAVADNMPWDEFARRVLLASGSTLQNGAANYFVLHKDTAELSETTAVTFLGMSIKCAHCHNHPLEKWTQDQYYSMANLFARVAIKEGDRGQSDGDLTVYVAPSGDIRHPRTGQPMPPAPLDGPSMALDDPGDRRVLFVNWLTAPDNRYFARALVNRVWRNFLGRGFVEPEDDLRQTNPASDEELLAALAKDFIAHKDDVKHLIQTILNSATYQRSSRPLAANAADTKYYSHYLVRRLPAEVILDAYSQVTGVPSRFAYGQEFGAPPSATPPYPVGVRALQLPDTQVASYFLTTFGRPDREQTCSCERQSDASVTQALDLNNGQILNEKLRDPRSRIAEWLNRKLTDAQVIDRLFLAALGRHPTASERRRLAAALAPAGTVQPHQGIPIHIAAAPGVKHLPTARRQALEDLFWAVLTDKEFLFNH